MTTAPKIELSPLALSAGVVAVAVQNSNCASQDSSSLLSLPKRSVTLTNAAPALKGACCAMKDLSDWTDGAIALLEKVERGAMSSQDLAKGIQGLLEQLNELTAKDLPDTDPALKALFAALTGALGKMISAISENSDPVKLADDLRGMLSQLKLPDSVKWLKPILASLTSAITEAAAASPKDAKETEEEKVKSLIETLIQMIQLVLGLQQALSENQATQLKVDRAISSKSLEVMQKSMEEQLKKLHELEVKIKKAKKAHFWQRIGMSALGALAVLATFVFLGPVAGSFALGLFVAQQTGGTEKMFGGLPPKYRLVAEIGFAVGVGLVGGGLQGIADGVLAGAAVAAESGGESAAAASVAQTAVQSTTPATAQSTTAAATQSTTAAAAQSTTQATATASTAQASSSIAKSSAESSAIKINGPTPKEALIDSFKGSAFNLGVQSFMSTTAIMDMAQLITKDKKKQMWISLALSLAFAFAATFGGMKIGGGSLSMSEALPEAAKSSQGWAAVNNMMKLLRNPYLIGGLTVGASTIATYFGVRVGKLKESQGDTQEEMGPIEARIAFSKMMAELMTVLVKSQTDLGRQQMESLQAGTERWQELTEPGEVAARVLA